MKILIVEGDHSLLETMREICQEEGFHVITHTSCEMALQEMRNGLLPSLIFCDQFPPGNGGIQLRDELQKNPAYQMIPFVLMRALKKEEHLLFRDVLIKPFSMEELLSHLNRIRPS